MPQQFDSSAYRLSIIDTPEGTAEVEDLQRQIWSGNDTEVVPTHILITAARNGGLLVGAYHASRLAGFVFGFPGLYPTPDGPRLKHCSQMLGVHPDHRDAGLGFALKRAQWQMVRHQGIDLITWTYDPLLSRNAFLNIARLGAVCNQYHRNEYGMMRDEMNAGLPSDRFEVNWWVNSPRVRRRLSSRPRLQLDLAHFLSAGAEILNPTQLDEAGLPHPTEARLPQAEKAVEEDALLLVEIPSNFPAVRLANPALALHWREHTRSLFEALFAQGYLVTDFIHLPGATARSFYVLSHGESTF